ncbi:MAG: hypothetical protein Q9183_000424 [Haloplaca sp. 2 TL-2023]
MTVQLSYAIDRTSKELKQPLPSDAASVAAATITHSASSNQLRSLWTVGAAALQRSWSEDALSKSSKRKPGLGEETGDELEVKATRTKATLPELDARAAVSDISLDPQDGTSEDEVLEVRKAKFASRTRTWAAPKLARRSWAVIARSPSPSRKYRPKANTSGRDELDLHASRVSSSHDLGNQDNPMSLGRQRRKSSPFPAKVTSGSRISSTSAVPASLPINKATVDLHRASRRCLALPCSVSSERLQGLGVGTSHKKDELSYAFRALNADFEKYVLTDFLLPWEHKDSCELNVWQIPVSYGNEQDRNHPLGFATFSEEVRRPYLGSTFKACRSG